MIYPSVSLNLLQLFNHGFKSFTVSIRQSIAMRRKMLLDHFAAFSPLLGIVLKSSNLLDLIVQQSSVIVFDFMRRTPVRHIVAPIAEDPRPSLLSFPRSLDHRCLAQMVKPLLKRAINIFVTIAQAIYVVPVRSMTKQTFVAITPVLIGSEQVMAKFYCLNIRLDKLFTFLAIASNNILKNKVSGIFLCNPRRSVSTIHLVRVVIFIAPSKPIEPHVVPVMEGLVTITSLPSLFKLGESAEIGPKTECSVEVKKISFLPMMCLPARRLIDRQCFSPCGLGAKEKECAND